MARVAPKLQVGHKANLILLEPAEQRGTTAARCCFEPPDDPREFARTANAAHDGAVASVGTVQVRGAHHCPLPPPRASRVGVLARRGPSPPPAHAHTRTHGGTTRGASTGPLAQARIADALLSLGRPEDALRWAGDDAIALSLRCDARAPSLIVRGKALAALGERDAALAALEEAAVRGARGTLRGRSISVRASA